MYVCMYVHTYAYMYSYKQQNTYMYIWGGGVLEEGAWFAQLPAKGLVRSNTRSPIINCWRLAFLFGPAREGWSLGAAALVIDPLAPAQLNSPTNCI